MPSNINPTRHSSNPTTRMALFAPVPLLRKTSEWAVSGLGLYVPWQPGQGSEQTPSLATPNDQQEQYCHHVCDVMHSNFGDVVHSAMFNDYNLTSGSTHKSHADFAQFTAPSEGSDFILIEDNGKHKVLADGQHGESSSDKVSFGELLVLPLQKPPFEHVCPQCGRSFRTRKGLTQHIKNVHRGLHRHDCTTCFRAFGRRDILARHRQKAKRCLDARDAPV
ncbi:hypothetical protein BJV82DRAFT_636202 [Fennellomyces sp. T-0311]|nr:hypothetical protein BJV82DRAFT_636202 [Fennellomyces sp. T-0311]